ncbi:MAG: mechanosensitive ion channel [bacterium]|nr:mechanosensitive ion channel [bacterium]
MNRNFKRNLLTSLSPWALGLCWLFSLVAPLQAFDLSAADLGATKTLHLAVVGPMKEGAAGDAFYKAAQVFADQYNAESSEHGYRLELQTFDDENDAQKAVQLARQIAQSPNILGVVGHNFSSVSLAAGPIYQELQIPAITPTSTNNQVTKDNPWYFRNIFSDAYQGRFLAQYAKVMLNMERVTVLYEDQPYGQFLAEKFQLEAKAMGMEVALALEYSTDEASLNQQLSELGGKLGDQGEGTLLFIAGHNKEVTKILHYLRDNDLSFQVLLPDAAAQDDFVQAFASSPKELQHPGYYTDGIYTAAPLLFDSASQRAQKFAQDYQEKFGHAPGWRAAYAFDAALLLTQAAQMAQLGEGDIKAQRIKLRDQLAAFSHLNQSFVGVTGINFFDAQGDMEKPLTMGQYRHNRLISAPLQMKAAGDPKRINGLDERIQAGLLAKVDEALFHRTYIVYTGVDLGEISELDEAAGTYKLNFDLWFRYRRGIDVRDIEFCNAVEPIKLRMPVEEVSYGNQIYRRYEVEGKFKEDFVTPQSPEHHNVGVCFSHLKLDRANLIFVPDVIGGARLSGPPERNERIEYKRSTGWLAENFWSYQTVLELPIQGNLKYIHETSKQVSFSSYYAGLSLKAEHSVIRNGVSPKMALILAPLFFLLALAFERRLVLPLWLKPITMRLLGPTERVKVTQSARPKTGFFYAHDYGETEVEVERPREFRPGFWTWAIKALAVMALVYNLEILSTDYFFQSAEIEKLALTRQVFDILWWFVPTLLFIRAVENFVWRELEISTGRDIPRFARVFFAAVIISLSVFGILAFVYGETVTSILGTSGIFVMIIGMAVQMNISNIFAGLVLNLEKSLKIGDWVQVGDIEEGRVMEINWRTVKIQTRDGAMIIIPNNSISETNFQNFTSPNRIMEILFEINIEKAEDYYQVVKVCTDAMKSVEEVLKEPEPLVRFDNYTHWSATYVCVYAIGDYGRRRVIHGKVWEALVAAFKKHKISSADFREEPEM